MTALLLLSLLCIVNAAPDLFNLINEIDPFNCSYALDINGQVEFALGYCQSDTTTQTSSSERCSANKTIIYKLNWNNNIHCDGEPDTYSVLPHRLPIGCDGHYLCPLAKWTNYYQSCNTTTSNYKVDYWITYKCLWFPLWPNTNGSWAMNECFQNDSSKILYRRLYTDSTCTVSIHDGYLIPSQCGSITEGKYANISCPYYQIPTINPTISPTNNPTISPTNNPTTNPSNKPTNYPSSNPTIYPSHNPTNNPSNSPTDNASSNPTNNPSNNPTIYPSNNPTNNPSNNPITATPTTKTLTTRIINDNFQYQVILSIILQYQQNTTNESLDKVESILANITIQIINTITANLTSYDCHGAATYNINFNKHFSNTSHITTTISLNASIIVCNQHDQGQITKFIQLKNIFIRNKINHTLLTSDVLIAEITSISIISTSVIPKSSESAENMATTNIIHQTREPEQSKSGNSFPIQNILYIAAGILGCCIITLCIIVVIKIKQIDKKEQNVDDMMDDNYVKKKIPVFAYSPSSEMVIANNSNNKFPIHLLNSGDDNINPKHKPNSELPETSNGERTNSMDKYYDPDHVTAGSDYGVNEVGGDFGGGEEHQVYINNNNVELAKEFDASSIIFPKPGGHQPNKPAVTPFHVDTTKGYNGNGNDDDDDDEHNPNVRHDEFIIGNNDVDIHSNTSHMTDGRKLNEDDVKLQHGSDVKLKNVGPYTKMNSVSQGMRDGHNINAETSGFDDGNNDNIKNDEFVID